ncbi:MAG TPA: Bax inhibitor-1/YccA family protein [Candidatus Scatovivens faecipullorum]|mgnify:CR=1 FL=1|nr:Bax inhibitor-1/YccA family protein [Candidatus Scatovivens faecipullorum]
METDIDNNKLLTKTFFWMFLGLLGTALVSAYTYYSGLYIKIVISNSFTLLLITELIVVLLFTFLFKKLPPTMVAILYFVYSFVNGVTFSTIFVIYELKSIVLLFIVSALLFGGLAFYGYKTDKDLSSWSGILFGTLIAGLLVSIINLFLGNSLLDIILDWVILFVFFGITAYDMNKIKALVLEENLDKSKLHIYAAMELYLDFINIFLRILSIFGKRRD